MYIILKKLLNTLKIWIKSFFVKSKPTVINTHQLINVQQITPRMCSDDASVLKKWAVTGFISNDNSFLPLAKLFELVSIRIMADNTVNQYVSIMIYPILRRFFCDYENIITEYDDETLFNLSNEVLDDVIAHFNVVPDTVELVEYGVLMENYLNNHNIVRLSKCMNVIGIRICQNKFLTLKMNEGDNC